MKRLFAAALVAALMIAGCGSSGQHRYTVTLPSGQKATAAHSPTFGLPPKGRPLPRSLLPTLVPTGLMLDTVDNPASAFGGLSFTAVAGYTSGSWPTYFQMAGRYRYVISVAVNTSHYARCLDVEPGDASPSEVVNWFYADIRHGFAKPCFYASLGNGMGPIQSNLARAGIARSRYWLWDADWTYSYHLDSGFDCTQFTDRYAFRNIDGSACTLAFIGVAPPPPPGPSHAQILSWAHARAASIAAYHRGPHLGYGCHQPVLTTGFCGQQGWRVNHYQVLLDPTNKTKVVCFGPHAQPKAAVCQIIRPANAAYSRAAASSHKAFFAKHCVPPPVGPGACKVFWNRELYFQGRVNHLLATSRY